MDNNSFGSLFEEHHFAPQPHPSQSHQHEQERAPDGETTNIELHGMLFEDIAVSGLTPMDVSLVARMVNDRIKNLEKECLENKSAGIDTLRMALLAAFDFASELYLLQQESGLAGKATAKRIDTVLEQLQKTLGPGRE